MPEDVIIDDPKELAKLEERERLDRQQLTSDIKDVLGSTAGRRVFWHLLTKCGIYDVTFTGNSNGNFREGMRSIGLSILADMNEANPRAFPEMQLENLEKEEHREKITSG